jgi:hypothetical protein
MQAIVRWVKPTFSLLKTYKVIRNRLVTNGVKVFAYFNDYVGDYKVGDFVRLTKKSYSPLGRLYGHPRKWISNSVPQCNLLATEPVVSVDGKLRIFNAYLH